ncbi:CDP-glycerol glycerophosphotransferase family protein [Shewanella sp. 10N.286.52.B9]|uniref:CDP-glycerol glycerophosphotransferase family protein n=1 Tax=Shewanella sp. 10N.286.52.B9 TaxID=1880837 RepID=UPI000C816C9C|nr:CDP-glycerol glycerophosphotransferase family protein [Shewanella sp. 10N.286.52.B9]PMG52454.1 CDP-glycerol--glycerophosphate glycerophosphotransferase [Shewanella sp. 10N.286.52.B9]
MKKKHYLFYISQNYSYAILRPLQDVILAQGGEIFWFLEGNEVDSKFLRDDEECLPSIDAIRSWKPDAVFAPSNLIPNFIPGLKVAVFHGFAAGKLNRRGRLDHFEIRGCFDLYCTQGPNTSAPFEALAAKHGYFSVKETGWPMLDPLFRPIENNPYVDDSDPRKTLLMCSTFSRNLSCAPHLYSLMKRLADKGKWRILVQFHPKMPVEIVNNYKAINSKNLTFIETDNVIPLLQSADVMLCDTSSILEIFLLLRRPVVTFRNQTNAAHLLNVDTEDEVESAIELALSYPPSLMAEIERYCQQLHPYQDGKSSERVLAATNTLIDSKEPRPNKPLNLLRMFKLRKKLGYWKC